MRFASIESRIRRALPLAWIPLGFGVVALAWPAQQYHWDTLERAYLLEHAGQYLRTWDGTPRSQFLSFAHVLELPLAFIVRAVLPGVSSLRALCVLEVLAGVALLWIAGVVAHGLRARIQPGSAREALWAALAAQALLAVAIAVWRMSSSGEEKMLALATQAAFLAAFWRALAAPAARHAGAAVAATLAFAILVHLTGAVLVPFAAAALAWLPPPLRRSRAALARAACAGTLIALLVYAVVAMWTTHVRTPAAFWDYLTFFHRADGIDFHAPANAPLAAKERFDLVLDGMGAFFGGPRWASRASLAVLAGAIVASAAWHRRRRPTAETALARTTIARHMAILGILWSAHFAFFEPANHESWTLVALLAVLAAAAWVPGRCVLALAGFAAILAVANRSDYAKARRPLPFEPYAAIVERDTRESDVVVLLGGVQSGQALRGSMAMRYFLGTGPDRRYASLYDILSLTEREYWPTPYTDPGALQAAIEQGQRVFAPGFMRDEIERANASGVVRIETEAVHDSLLRITRIVPLAVP